MASLAASPLAAQTAAEIYREYRLWIAAQPPAVQRSPASAVFEQYRAKLKSGGLPGAEIERRIEILRKQPQRLEAEYWNRILTAEQPRFNTAPNAFLVEMVKGVKPGAALDVGMGQGRNAIYLAQQGWDVTGFDPAGQAVALARKQAEKLGVKIATFIQTDDEFQFGAARWDLIVLSYVGVRNILDKIESSLKPGGIVVVEAFHRDAAKEGPIGDGVVWDANELLTTFRNFRILRYEDTATSSDFGGRRTTRVVRLCAQKE